LGRAVNFLLFGLGASVAVAFEDVGEDVGPLPVSAGGVIGFEEVSLSGPAAGPLVVLGSAEGSLVLSGESPGITGRNDRTGIPHSEVEIDPVEVKQV
jgi:hypothetical protein